MVSITRHRVAAEIARQGRLADEIARAQSDISTQKRIAVPSDDPAAAARVSQIRRSQADQTVWASNVESALNIANQVDTTLTSVAIGVDRAKELLLAARSTTLSASDRTAIAVELRGLADDFQDYANAFDSTGRPLFPTGDPLQVSISGSVRVSATVSRTDAFEGVPTDNGTQSLRDILLNAANAVVIADDTSRGNAIVASLDELDDARLHMQSVRAGQGVRGARLESARDSLATIDTRLAEERAGLEQTDIATTTIKLNAKLLSLEAAQAAFARANRQTLFDILG